MCGCRPERETSMTERPVGYLNQEQLDALQEVSTATVTTQLLRRGIRSTFLPGVKPLRPDLRLIGYAFTLRYIPTREDLSSGAHYDNSTNPQRITVESVGDGDVLVIDARCETGAAVLGDILITRMMMRGAAGVVTDGAFRDSPGIQEIDLPTYAAGAHATMSSILHFPVDFNVPIGCAGIAVMPGDLIFGDAEGVVVIPHQLAGEVVLDALEQERYETWALKQIQAGTPITDIYPPSDETRQRYEEERQEPERRPKGID